MLKAKEHGNDSKGKEAALREAMREDRTGVVKATLPRSKFKKFKAYLIDNEITIQHWVNKMVDKALDENRNDL